MAKHSTVRSTSPQSSVAEMNPASTNASMSQVQSVQGRVTRMPIEIRVGGVTSCTSMTWMASPMLPAQSVARMWRSTVKVCGQDWATVSSTWLMTGASSQSSVAVTVDGSNGGSPHSTVRSSGWDVTTGASVSSRWKT